MTGRLVLPILLVAIPLSAGAQTLEEVPPPTPERQALDELVKSIVARDARAARRAYERIARDYRGKEAADEAAWHYAGFLFEQGGLDKAQEIFLSLKRSGRENRWVSLALIGLSEVAEKRGDERAMLGYLEEAVKVKPFPTDRNLRDTRDTRQEAILRLARYYQDKRDFKKALEYYTRWEPRSWCGTCRASMMARRKREMALCQMQLGEHAAVIRDRLQLLQKEDWLSSFDSWLVWRLYNDAGQIGDLRKILDQYETTRKPRRQEAAEFDLPPAYALRGLLRAQALAEKKDVAALVALCQEKSRFGAPGPTQFAEGDLAPCAAAEALAALGGAEVEPLKAALGKKPKVTGWLIYALGRSPAPSALTALTAMAERERGDDPVLVDNIAYALALKGEPGRKVLKRLVENKSVMGEAARSWLGCEAEPLWPTPTWPRPKPGSLPRVTGSPGQ